MKYTLAFTTYNSASYMIKQLERNYFELSEGLIDEIIIQDDLTDDYNILKEFETNNIKIYQNSQRLLPLLGRVNLLNKCKNDWVILMDSDNFLNKKSFDALRPLSLQQGVIYAPGFATPEFDFKSQYANTMIDMHMAANRIGVPGVNWINVLLNTGNYLVPRQEYLEVAKDIDTSFPVHPCEVLYFNYLWLKSGRNIFCSENYEYEHTLREDSFYRTHSSIPDLEQSLYNLYLQHR